MIRGSEKATIATTTSLIVTAMGMLVTFGWWTQNYAIVQLHENFAPMQYNTALCFIMVGCSFFFGIKSRHNQSRIFSFLTALIATLTLGEYILNVDFGIDELLWKHSITTHTSHAGRMAPSTSICFLLSSAIIFLRYRSSMRNSLFIWIGTLIILGISATSLISYMFSIDSTYLWQAYTRMAPHTAFGFLLIGFGMITILYQNERIEGRYIPLSFAAATFFTFTLLSLGSSSDRSKYFYDVGRSVGASFKSLTELQLKETTNALIRMARRSAMGIYESDENWRMDAQNYHDHFGIFTNLARITEKGIVTWAFPNNQAVSLTNETKNKLNQFKNKAANYEIITEKTHGFAMVFPIFPADHTKGYIFVDFSYEKLFHLISTKIKSDNFNIRVSSQDNVFMSKIYDESFNFPSVIPINFVNLNWKVAVSLTDEFTSNDPNKLPEVIFFLGVMFAFLIYSLINLTRLNHRAKTKSQAKENAIRKLNNKLKRTIDGSSAGIWSWERADENSLYWSPRFFNLLGYNDGELEATMDNFRAIIHPEDLERALESFKKALTSKNNFEIEYRLNTKSGTFKWFRNLAIIEVDSDGETIGLSGSILDIDDLKEKEMQLQHAKKTAEDASRHKSMFLANMSHEIRTPLNGIIALTEILKEQMNQERNIKIANTILASSDSLLTVLNDVLDYSKLEAGKIDIELRAINLKEVLKDTIELYEATANKKGLQLEHSFSANVPHHIMGDEIRIRQIVTNFISNAIKFTEKGNITVTVSYTSRRPPWGMVSISVQDEGIGIEPKDINYLFQSFNQIDSSTTRKYGGTGLGLSISNTLAELMNGRIYVTSEPGKGSTFSLVIDTEEASTDITPIKSKETRKLDYAHLKVMIAEDNKTNQTVLKLLLKKMKIEATIVNDGLEALEVLKNQHFDLIFMDCQMPQLDGYKTTARIREEFPHLKKVVIIAATASVMKEDLEKCLKVGMNDIVSKPISSKNLEKVLGKYFTFKERETPAA